MSVHILFTGRLGNNLFQYALGRIIAESKGWSLTCERLSTPKDNVPSILLEDPNDFFPELKLTIPGKHYDRPIDHQYAKFFIGPNWDGHTIDLEQILSNPNPRRILLRGSFHQIKYYRAYKEKIRKWYSFNHLPIQHKIHPDDVLINLRRGSDYEREGWCLPNSYYIETIKKIKNINNIYVCGTGIDSEMISLFSKYNPIYFNGTPLEHFSFISQFNRIILSNSTFAWWAAYLSNASAIYSARGNSSRYGFTGFPNTMLAMEPERFIEVILDQDSSLQHDNT